MDEQEEVAAVTPVEDPVGEPVAEVPAVPADVGWSEGVQSALAALSGVDVSDVSGRRTLAECRRRVESLL